jgi:hypothetical protein
VIKTRYAREIFVSGQLTGRLLDYSRIFGQFFPYQVYDVYDEQIIPENLGDYEPTAENNNPPRTAADIINNAKANLAVTQGTASFFFNPEDPLSQLKTIVAGIKALGYTFVSPTSLPSWQSRTAGARLKPPGTGRAFERNHGTMAMIRVASVISAMGAAVVLLASGAYPRGPVAPHGRPLPRTLYGVTADDVSGLNQMVMSSRHLARRGLPRRFRRRHRHLGDRQRGQRELDGTLPGRRGEADGRLSRGRRPAPAHRPHPVRQHRMRGRARRAEPLGFSRRYVPAAVRAGIGYVFLSYYEDACGNRRPSARTWTAYFRSLHALYPRARLGFGEIGLADPVTPRTMRAAKSLIRYYYGLRIRLPYYTGGYFWWYYAEDCLPYATRPLWRALSAGFRAEKAAQR